jgi:hypothetical protein
MSNPTISPGYGFVPCSHDDPKRSHYFQCGRWEGIAGCIKPVCEFCAKLPNRKPVEIPEGWELVPEGEKFQRSFGWISTCVSEDGGVHVPEKAIGVPVGEVADNGDYGCASIRAFIRRKPVQPTVEPSKPAVEKPPAPPMEDALNLAWSAFSAKELPSTYKDFAFGFRAGFESAQKH